MKIRNWALGALSAIAAVVMLPMPAAAVESVTVEVGDTATLQAGGAGVVVQVSVTCIPTPGATTGAGVNAFLTQRRGNSIAQGNGVGQEVLCDGTSHSYQILVVSTGVPFKSGDAYATGTATACDEFGCDFFDVQDNEVIRIRH
jgi:hypothetical protein